MAVTKSYFHCRWIHDHPDEPVDLYSELDADRYELRKVYVFKDGHGEAAGRGIEMGTTWLSPEPCPPLAEIAAQAGFEPRETTREEFEAVWRKYAG